MFLKKKQVIPISRFDRQNDDFKEVNGMGGFEFGWIGTGVLIMVIVHINSYFVLKDILKELKKHIKE